IACLGASFARRFAEYLGLASTRLHNSGQNLESRGFSRAIRTDEPEDFALANFKAQSPDRLKRAIALPKVVNVNCLPRAGMPFGGRMCCDRSRHFCFLISA